MFGVFAGVAVFLTAVVVIGLVVLFLVQREKKSFGFKMLFTAYFYLMSIISLLAIFFGISGITKAVASDVFGRDFSYYNYTDTIRSEPISKESLAPGVDEVDEEKIQAENAKREKERIESLYQEDLYNGLSMLVVGVLFLGVHVFGWRKLESDAERSESVLHKGYIILQLVAFSIITLITLPLGVSQALRFALGQSKPEYNIVPGEPLSIAIWATPIWLFFVWLTIRTLRRQEAK